MNKKFQRSAFVLGLCLALTGAWALSPLPVQAGKKSKSPEAEPLTAEKLATLDNKGVLYEYKSNDRKDPFRPFINFSQIERSIPTDSERPLTPLEKYALNQFQLVGIILAGDMNNYALVEDPEHIGHTVRKGDMIGNLSGQVKDIKFNEVIIEEPYLDIYDKEQTRTISLRLRDLDEDSYLQLQEDTDY
ncbi:pilus assembly protein PilP [bacterium]|nr:pilus assembly protein PilP [bacterium]